MAGAVLRTLDVGGRSVRAAFTRKRVKNINMRLAPDGTLRVSYPFFVPLAAAEAAVLANADRFLPRAPAPPPGMLLYHGAPLVLRPAGAAGEAPRLEDGALILSPAGEDGLLREALRWRDGQARLELTRLCLAVWPRFAAVTPFPELRFREMTSRWGSCSPARCAVTLNTRLAAVPPECAEYVVWHEFTHFLHPDHSPRFRAALTAFLPDWRRRKARLNEYA